MRRLRRCLAPVLALIVAVGGIWIASASAQTDPQPTAPLGTWCPHVASPVVGPAQGCKVVPDPDWTPPTTTPPTSTTTTVPTTTSTVPTTTTDPTTTPPVTTTPTPPPAALKGWQLNENNVGLKPHGLSCDSLEPYTGPQRPAAGTTIYRKRITTPLNLYNGNILVDQSCIRPSTVGEHNEYLVTTTDCSGQCKATAVGNVVIRDSEIDGCNRNLSTEFCRTSASLIANADGFIGVGTLQRNWIHGMGSGISFFETGSIHSALAEHNYVNGLRSAGDSHNEAATIRDFRQATGRTVKFLNNRLDCSSGNATGGLFIQPTWLPIHNVTIQGNLLEGEGYNLYLERTGNATYGNVRAIDNRFRPTGWGPAATPSGPGYAEWRDNYRYDSTQPDGKGAVVSP